MTPLKIPSIPRFLWHWLLATKRWAFSYSHSSTKIGIYKLGIIKRFCITNRVKKLHSVGHLRTLKDSKWTFYTWKPACFLSSLPTEAQEAWSYFTVDSQLNICWAGGQTKTGLGPIINFPTRSSVSRSPIKLTQINCLFLLDKYTPFRFQRQGAVRFSWLAMTAPYQEQGKRAQGITQSDENSPRPPRALTAPPRLVQSAPVPDRAAAPCNCGHTVTWRSDSPTQSIWAFASASDRNCAGGVSSRHPACKLQSKPFETIYASKMAWKEELCS